MWMLLWALAGCDLETIGAVECDEWCSVLLDRAEGCAADQGITFDQFAGQGRGEVNATCQDEAATRTDTQCQVETATVSNMTCEQIAEAVSEFAG